MRHNDIIMNLVIIPYKKKSYNISVYTIYYVTAKMTERRYHNYLFINIVKKKEFIMKVKSEMNFERAKFKFEFRGLIFSVVPEVTAACYCLLMKECSLLYDE